MVLTSPRFPLLLCNAIMCFSTLTHAPRCGRVIVVLTSPLAQAECQLRRLRCKHNGASKCRGARVAMAGVRPTTIAGATKLLWLLADYRAFAILAILRFSNLRFSYLLRLSKDDPIVGCVKAAQSRSTGQMLIRHIPRLIVGMYNGTECHLRTFSNYVNVSMLMLNPGKSW